MKKNSKILVIIFISSLLAINYLGSNDPVNSMKTIGQEDNSLKTLSEPKTSGYTITEKWRHKLGSDGGRLDISEDGNYIVISNTTSLTLFKKDSNLPVWIYNTTNNNIIHDLAISKNGEYIVASDARQVFLLNNDPETPKTVVWKYPNTPVVGANFKADIAANGEYIAVGNISGHVMLFDNTPATSKPYLWECDTGDYSISDIAISGDGNYTIAGTNALGGNIYLFNKTTTASKTYEWSEVFEGNQGVAISEDGNYILNVEDDFDVYLYNITNIPATKMWDYNYIFPVRSMEFSYDGQYLILCYNAYVDYFNNTPSGSKQPMWTFDTGESAMAADISKYGDYIAVAGESDSLYFLNNTKTSPKIEEWESDISGDPSFTDVAISADGRYFVGVTEFNDLYLFHHAIPISSGGGYLPPGDDDDDDDDDTGVGVVVVVIIIVSVGGVVVVIIILIKNGIIGASKSKKG